MKLSNFTIQTSNFSFLLPLQRALPADVFNVEVDFHHVYEVGKVGALVHNACAGKNFENYRAKHYVGQAANYDDCLNLRSESIA